MAYHKENTAETSAVETKPDILDAPPDELVIWEKTIMNCTEIHVNEFRFKWTVENFSLLPVDVNCPTAIESQPFAVGLYQENYFVIRMYPIGKKERCRNRIALYLRLYAAAFRPEGLLVKFKMLFRNSKQEIIRSKSIGAVFYAGTFKGWNNFINRDLLNGSLRPDDQLIIELELAYATGDSHTLSFDNAREKRNNPGVDLPLLDMSEDFSELLDSQKQSDLTLVVEGESFEAHKAILFARSSVFQELFEHEMEETKQNRLELKGCSKAVADALLRFIYTGCPGEVTDATAENLLIAADKYAVPRLKVMCENYLIQRMTIENASSMLVLADEHRCDQMKEHALVFIKSNSCYVRNSESWRAMLNSKPNLVQELIAYIMGTGLK